MTGRVKRRRVGEIGRAMVVLVVLGVLSRSSCIECTRRSGQ